MSGSLVALFGLASRCAGRVPTHLDHGTGVFAAAGKQKGTEGINPPPNVHPALGALVA